MKCISKLYHNTFINRNMYSICLYCENVMFSKQNSIYFTIINSLHEKRIQFKLLCRQLLTILNLVTRYLIDIVYLFNIIIFIN